MMLIDLRSDTVTRPTPGMLDAMCSAKVGDDVFGDDPTVNSLQKKAAELFGMEDALFCASGTMTNQIAIKVHTTPGDEVICDKLAHVYAYEGGGIAFNSSASVKLIDGDRGRLNAEQVSDAINADNVHFPRTKLVALENTVNRGGGAIYDFTEIRKIKEVCTNHNLKLHLDGARLFNALTETTETPKDYGNTFDSISLCLSKGMGIPVGSILLGSRVFIKQAKRVRKVFGGGWRQAGFLAAAGIYALDNNITRLKDDHKRAKVLWQTVSKLDYVTETVPQATNIVIFELNEKVEVNYFLKYLEENGILASQFGKRNIRMVTHMDISDDMIAKTVETVQKFRIQ